MKKTITMSSTLFRIPERLFLKIVRFLISLVLFFLFISTQAQDLKPNSSLVKSSGQVESEFKNAGEQEDYWAKELFKRDYKLEHYQKYKCLVVSNGVNYQYKDVIITIGANVALKTIFDKGIFYPDVISKSFKYHPKMKINRDSLKVWLRRDIVKAKNKNFYALPKIDSLWISDFEEMKFLEKHPTKKRFRFWLHTTGFLNPTVYFIELTNENANAATDMITFINGAKLTFFEEGWVII